MNTLRIYVWKEWREQRATLAVLAVVLLFAVGILAVVLPGETLRNPIAFAGVIGLAMLATLMSVGSDLLARERQRGAIGFLERLPASLGTVFWGKLCAFLALLLAAVAYGALLAYAAALLCTGAPPVGTLGDLPGWLPAAAVALSLWVFAVSAWMPSGALTFPTTVFLLVCLAWPALLAARSDSFSDPLFWPTYPQRTWFFTLCIVGAPVSAWAAFVVGSRRGRSPRFSSLMGLSVAVLTFLPAWTWAGLRYAQMKRAPFEILNVSLGLDGQHAFVNLERSRESNRYTALVLDLERHDWRLAGELDESCFVEERSYSRSKAFIETGCPSFVLIDRGVLAEERELWDGRTARALRKLGPREQESGPAPGPSAADFGVPGVPSRARVSWAGLGHQLSFRGEKGKVVVIYRDPVSGLVQGRAKILAGLGVVHSICEVRVRPGRWLVANPGRLTWVDPVSADTQDAGCIAKGERVGPSVTDGRLMLLGADGVSLLDPETCERTPIRVLSDRDVTITNVSPMPWGSPLPSDSPSVVSMNANASTRIALFDPRAGTIRMAPTDAHFDTLLVGSIGVRAIGVEDRRRIVSYDFEHDRREVLFCVDALDPGRPRL